MNWALLAAAGVLGGLTGSIAGLPSVATYPALLVVGLPPVTANVTNTVALVFNGIGSFWGSRPELAGQGAWIKRIRRGRRCNRRSTAAVNAGGGIREGCPDLAGPGLCRDPAAACKPSRSESRSPPTTYRPGAAGRRSDLRNLHLRRLLRRGGRRATARDAIAGRWRDARACQRRQERDPRRRELRCSADFCVLRTGELAYRHRRRCRMPDRIAARSRGGPPCGRRTDSRGDRCGRARVSGQTRSRRVRLGQVEWAVALDNSRAHVDQVLRRRVQLFPRLPAGLAHQIARPRALDHNAELETRHRDIPVQP